MRRGVQRGGAQGGYVDVGGVPVPFCILNSSTSVQPFSVVAEQVVMSVCTCARTFMQMRVFVSLCICACSAEGAGCYPHLN